MLMGMPTQAAGLSPNGIRCHNEESNPKVCHLPPNVIALSIMYSVTQSLVDPNCAPLTLL